jgi:hypothetical protein
VKSDFSRTALSAGSRRKSPVAAASGEAGFQRLAPPRRHGRCEFPVDRRIVAAVSAKLAIAGYSVAARKIP